MRSWISCERDLGQKAASNHVFRVWKNTAVLRKHK